MNIEPATTPQYHGLLLMLQAGMPEQRGAGRAGRTSLHMCPAAPL